MPDYVVYDVTVKTLTWLHIGSGETLMQDFDYALHEGKTWRLNLDALLDEKVPNEEVARQVAQIPPAQLLKEPDFREGSPLFRYVLPGEPRSKQPGSQVVEQIKDAWDRPYLPGSSLKGALRTAILWNAVKQSGRPIALHELNGNPKFAASGVEKNFLRQGGQNLANYDLFRALQVSDSEPLDRSALTLANAQVIGGRTQKGAPIELETIRPGVEMRVRIKLDTALFGDWARAGGLELGNLRAWLERLPEWVQAHSRTLAERGLAWCSGNADRSRLIGFYRQIVRDSSRDACFLQIGWGGGWDSKTLGNLLQQDPTAFEEIAEQYRLRRLRRGTRARPGTPFPSTRRMVVRGQDAEVRGPLGWVRLTFERRA